jgi:hypothetical protein
MRPENIEAVTQLLNRQDSEEVMELSILLNDIEQMMRVKALSEQEYANLMIDVERLRKIIELKENLELNQLIHEAILGLVELAKLIKL